MSEHLDILDERDPLAFPFAGSLLVHGLVVVGLVFGWFWMNRAKETLGDLHPAGGPAYAVSPVKTIPIPQREAPPNPVANDTQSMVPTAPARQTTEKPQTPDKNAFEIAEKKKKETPKVTHQQQYTQPAPKNQVYSHQAPAVSNPMYSAPGGAGQVGIGPNSMLGNRLGWYAELVRQQIAQSWRTSGLDTRSQNAPTIVGFTILRDGTVRDPQVIQSSGNPSIDNTALRAIYDSKLPPLPPQITDTSIAAQFTFSLR